MGKRERIKQAMADFSLGLLEAKRLVEKVDLWEQIERASTVEDIKAILHLINR